MEPAGWACILDLRRAAFTIAAMTPLMATKMTMPMTGVKYPKLEKPVVFQTMKMRKPMRIVQYIAEQIGFELPRR